MKNNLQISIFDYNGKIVDNICYNTDVITLSNVVINKLSHYNLEEYIRDIETIGLEKTWDYICQFVIDNSDTLSTFLDVKNFGELYEIGLATQDKILKKKSGQYYTPDDIAKVMSEWLLACKGTAVCDVGCGTGKLILTYLDLLGYKKARALISSGNLYLYDFDNVALKICRTTIAVKYGLDIASSINDTFCDFLDSDIKLPEDSKVISNPPYAKIEKMQTYWKHTDVLMDSKELYSAFMEKIFDQARSAVVITPFSFISGDKFYSLRKVMSKRGYGFIVSFDNVPGNIFCGRKHGIFNTNTANSVRAAITVMHQSDKKKGYRVSRLIRFKNEERNALLNTEILENSLPESYQIVDEDNKKFVKVGNDLSEIFRRWKEDSKYTVKDIISEKQTEYMIDIPNTCRYFTTASGHKLKRTGSITIYIEEKRIFNFVYCFINSSFAYWWWRIFDGGITYPVNLLNVLPLPLNLLSEGDDAFFEEKANELLDLEKDCIITKANAGAKQENIKFPKSYRDSINERILQILGFNLKGDVFDGVHSNHYFENGD